jgi:2'-5' RNA ligase
VWNAVVHLHDQYPVFDEGDFSELEQETALRDWEYMSEEFKRPLAKRFRGLTQHDLNHMSKHLINFWKDLFAKAPPEDKELSKEEREFLADTIEDMDSSQLWELAYSTDENFPEVHDDDQGGVDFENNFDEMAMEAPVEKIVQAAIGDDLDTLFDGDADAFVHFLGDYGDYQNWRAGEQAQSRLFPTGEPEHLMGPTMYPGESVMEDTHSYATTQAVPPEEVRALVQAARDQIDHDDLDPDEGFGPDPHVTILYGLGDDQEREATEILKKAGPLKAKIDAVDTFENDDYDVVIFRLESEDMQRVHDELDTLPNDNEWPEYKPHMTIAYVQPGLGRKYADRLESDLVGKNFVANQAEFSNTADDRVVVDLREGTTEAFENLSEQSPLFGTDVLTEEPDEAQIMGALYPVLNRTNRRVVSINSASGQTTALLDSGASLDMTMRDGSWWATTGHGDYDLLSPTDQERLVKELNGMLEAVLEGLLTETTASISQDGYDLVIQFSEYPTSIPTPAAPEKPAMTRKQKKDWREKYSIYSPEQQRSVKLRKKLPKSMKGSEPETGFESVQEQGEKRIDYVKYILPVLQRDPEFAELGTFKQHTVDSVRSIPHYRNWKDVKAAADRMQHLLTHAGASTEIEGDQITDVVGVTSGDQIRTEGGGLLGAPIGGGAKPMSWGERYKRFRGRGPKLQPPGEYRKYSAAASPAAPAPAPVAKPSLAGRVGRGIKKAAVSSYQRAKSALSRKKPETTPLPPAPPARGQSRRPPGAITAPAIPGQSPAQAAMKQKWKKKGPVGAEEDTYTSDVSSTDTIPITRPTKKRRRRGSVKIPGIKDASRRRVTRTYRVMGESMSRASQAGRVGEPIRVIMRPSQIEALEKKPVWSALSESGVISKSPFKMSNEEFFEVVIDTMRREWNEANTATLLDEVGSVAPQAHRKILERAEPKIAAEAIAQLVREILEAQAEAEIEDGPCGTVADWIRKQKLQGKEIGTAELAEHLQGSVDTVRELLEDFPLDQKVLEYLKSLDGSIAKAASQLIEDKHTDTGGSLSTMADPSGAALGSVIQGYGEQDQVPEPPPDELPPETPTEVAVSSRTWAPDAMFKLHIQTPDGTTDWVMRTVVGHEGEGEGSALIYKDEAGNIMRLPHDQVDQGMSMKAVMSPDEMGVESAEEVPAEVAEPIGEQDMDPESEKLNRDSEFTRALTAYQQSKSENDWSAVREAAQRVTGKTGPELDRLLGQFAGQPAQEPTAQPMEKTVSNEVRTRVTEDKEVSRSLRRFQMTQNEAYLLRATDRAVRLGAPTHSRARRLIDELAGVTV